jgi:TonB family protein
MFSKLRFASTSILAALTLCAQIACSAQTAGAKERVQQIAEASSLTKAGSAPWHLVMSFQLYDLAGKPADQGTIEEWWAAPGVYRRVITSVGYKSTIPGEDQPSGDRRTKYLVNLLLDQVADPVPSYGDFQDLAAVETKRNAGKVQLICYSVLGAPKGKIADIDFSHPEFCVEPGQDALRIRYDSGNFAAVRNRIAKFRGIELGLDNSLLYGGRQAISGHVEKLESYNLVANPVEMTKAPLPVKRIPGAVIAGKIIRKEQPIYPIAAKVAHISGTVILEAIISKEGKISSLEVISSPDRSLSTAAQDAVGQWTYQPYLLNGQPTEVDTTITVNFNLGIR